MKKNTMELKTKNDSGSDGRTGVSDITRTNIKSNGITEK